MTQEENKSPTAREMDEFSQSAAMEMRLAEKKVAPPAEIANKTTEQDNEEENGSGNSDADQENSLGAKKSEAQNKPSAADQLLKKATEQIIKKGAKKLMLNPGTWVAIGWGLLILAGIILAIFLIFNVTMAYRCWNEGGLMNRGTIFVNYWTGNYIKIANKIYSGTCGIADTTPAPKPADTATKDASNVVPAVAPATNE